MSYIIVGGFGFIGKHLINSMESTGQNFTIMTRKDPEIIWTKFPYILDNSIDEDVLKNLANTHKTLVYLASSSIPATGALVREMSGNVEPAINLIDKMTNYNPELRIIYLSSGGQIYGNDYQHPVSENDICLPVSPYGYGKLMVEQSLAYLHRTKGTKIAVLRVANPVGRWQTGIRQGIVNVVFEALWNDQPVNIFGTGNEKRDYIDADELAELIIRVANTEFSHATWNIGSNVATSTIDLISMVERIVGKQAKKIYLERRPVDPEYAVLNCDKARAELKWSVQHSLEETLEKTLKTKLELRRLDD